MKAQDAGALQRVFIDSAHGQVFTLSEELPLSRAAAPENPDTRLFMASVSFSGECSGRVLMAFTMELFLLASENVLGVRPELGGKEPDAVSMDVVGELLNVVCGRFLTAVEGDRPVFNLEPPEMRPIAAADWEEMRAKESCRAISAEGEPVLLCLELRSAV